MQLLRNRTSASHATVREFRAFLPQLTLLTLLNQQAVGYMLWQFLEVEKSLRGHISERLGLIDLVKLNAALVDWCGISSPRLPSMREFCRSALMENRASKRTFTPTANSVEHHRGEFTWCKFFPFLDSTSSLPAAVYYAYQLVLYPLLVLGSLARQLVSSGIRCAAGWLPLDKLVLVCDSWTRSLSAEERCSTLADLIGVAWAWTQRNVLPWIMLLVTWAERTFWYCAVWAAESWSTDRLFLLLALFLHLYRFRLTQQCDVQRPSGTPAAACNTGTATPIPPVVSSTPPLISPDTSVVGGGGPAHRAPFYPASGRLGRSSSTTLSDLTVESLLHNSLRFGMPASFGSLSLATTSHTPVFGLPATASALFSTISSSSPSASLTEFPSPMLPPGVLLPTTSSPPTGRATIYHSETNAAISTLTSTSAWTGAGVDRACHSRAMSADKHGSAFCPSLVQPVHLGSPVLTRAGRGIPRVHAAGRKWKRNKRK